MGECGRNKLEKKLNIDKMGKIILEFNSEEEGNDARLALDGYKWKIAMWDLDQELRKIVKYGQFDGREATFRIVNT